MFKKALYSGIILLAVAKLATAAERQLTLDPGASKTSFTLGATMHTVHGTVRLARGSVLFGAVPGPASGEVVAEATTAETGNDKRDKKMHKDVLESAAHSEVVLSVQRLEGQLPSAGTGNLTVHGTLRLLGKDHPVQLPVEVQVDGDRVEVKAEFEVPYVEWGLKDPSKFVMRVQKHVTVTVEASGTVAATAEESAER